jgi:hypothetical protein
LAGYPMKRVAYSRCCGSGSGSVDGVVSVKCRDSVGKSDEGGGENCSAGHCGLLLIALGDTGKTDLFVAFGAIGMLVRNGKIAGTT